MKPADRHELFARLRELDPQPRTELVYASPFELLVAVMLSAQSSIATGSSSMAPSTACSALSSWGMV